MLTADGRFAIAVVGLAVFFVGSIEISSGLLERRKVNVQLLVLGHDLLNGRSPVAGKDADRIVSGTAGGDD